MYNPDITFLIKLHILHKYEIYIETASKPTNGDQCDYKQASRN